MKALNRIVELWRKLPQEFQVPIILIKSYVIEYIFRAPKICHQADKDPPKKEIESKISEPKFIQQCFWSYHSRIRGHVIEQGNTLM